MLSESIGAHYPPGMQYGLRYRNRCTKEPDVNRRVLYILSGLLAAGLAAAGVVTACSADRDPTAGSAGTPSAAPATSAGVGLTASVGPVTPTPATPQTPTAAPTVAPTTGGGTGGPGAPAACAASDLALAQLPGGEGAAGTVIVSIGLTNRSGRACSLNGYPEFTLAGSAGDQQVAIEHDGLGMATFQAKPSPVTAAPSGRVGFLLAYINRPTGTSGSCTAATTMSLRVGAARVSGPVQVSVCGEPMKVSPFVSADKLLAG
jgi:Protein of unknown function (DUF4232)